MSKGTIIYIGGFELPDKNAAAHRVLGNGKILREIGYNVVLIGVNKLIGHDISILSTYEKVQGFDSFYIPYPKAYTNWFNYLTGIESFIEVFNEYPDVKAIVCYNYQSVAFMKLIRFARINKIKVLADCTEWYGAQGRNTFLKAIKGIDSFIRMRILQKKVDGLIVISKYLKDYYSKHKNIVLIPPLVDLAEEKWQIEGKYNHYYSANNHTKIRLVYSGSPGFRKDKINKIIHALYLLKNVSDYDFTIIGINMDKYLSYYPKDQTILNELADKIRFLGRISHQDSLKYTGEADFSIFIREDNIISRAGFPTKFVESISCGTPVITNSTSNISDYLVEGENGFMIEADSINEDIRKIFYMSDKGLRGNKRNFNRKQFDYRNYLTKLNGFIHKVEGKNFAK